MNSLQELQNLRLANDIRVDALQDEPSPWNFLVPNRNVLYYTFDASAGSVIDIETVTSLTAFNSTQKNAARSILAYVSQLVGVTFTEVATSAQADFHFAATDLQGNSNVSGLNYTYAEYSSSGDQIVSLTAESLIWLDNVQFATANNNPLADSHGYETLLHEIGHALGLGHPFEATSQSPENLAPAEDNTNNTVMSYTQAGTWKTTFQSYDVLALTWIYGGDGLGGTWGYNSTQGNTLNATTTPTLIGTDLNDNLQGTNGDDLFVPGLGADVVNGGAGTDTVVLKMFPSFHTMVQTAPGTFISTYGSNSVTLNSVEQVRFGTEFQTTLPVTSLLSGEVKTQVERLTDLYLAFFGRAPDVGGLEYWQEQLLEGQKTQTAITIDFAFSDEAKALFPATGSNREFVRTVYVNSFGREPDAGGWDYWTQHLDSLGTTDLRERGTFVGAVLLGAYAPTSGPEDRTKLTHKHDVALHYVNELSLQTQEGFDGRINDLLALVTLDPATKIKAIAVIDYALNNPVTLAGVMDDTVLFNSLWGA